MSSSLKLYVAVFLMSMLVLSPEMGTVRVGEAAECETQSKKFKGICLSGSNCASICKTESFQNGHCSGITRQCYCSKPC